MSGGFSRLGFRAVDTYPVGVRIKVAACGPALARRYPLHFRAIDVHDEDLVAFHVAMRGLKDQPLPVRGKVRFGVLAAERKLAYIAQVDFLWRAKARRGLIRGIRESTASSRAHTGQQRRKNR